MPITETNPIVVTIESNENEEKQSFIQALNAMPWSKKGNMVGLILGIVLLQVLKNQGCTTTSIPGLPNVHFPGSKTIQYMLVCGTSINYMHNLGAFFDAMRKPCQIKTFKEGLRCLSTLVSMPAFPIYIFSSLPTANKFMGVINCTQSTGMSVMIMLFLLGQISNIASYCGAAIDTYLEVGQSGYNNLVVTRACCKKIAKSCCVFGSKTPSDNTCDLDESLDP